MKEHSEHINATDILRLPLRYTQLENKAKTICQTIVSSKDFYPDLSKANYLDFVKRITSNNLGWSWKHLGGELNNIYLTVELDQIKNGCSKSLGKISSQGTFEFKCVDYVKNFKGKNLDQLKSQQKELIKAVKEPDDYTKNMKVFSLVFLMELASA